METVRLALETAGKNTWELRWIDVLEDDLQTLGVEEDYWREAVRDRGRWGKLLENRYARRRRKG